MNMKKRKPNHSSVSLSEPAPDGGPVEKEARRCPDRRGADPEDEKPLICPTCGGANWTWGELRANGENSGRLWCSECGTCLHFVIDLDKEFRSHPESAPEGGAGPDNAALSDRRGHSQ